MCIFLGSQESSNVSTLHMSATTTHPRFPVQSHVLSTPGEDGLYLREMSGLLALPTEARILCLDSLQSIMA
jgi:hypothetical protein